MDKMLLCCKCGEIPEILNVHTDNSKIELKCKNCGIFEILINDYYDKLSKKNYFNECHFCSKTDNLYYCYECRHNICEKCKKKDSHKTHKFIIKLEKKEDYCPKHSQKFKYFCNDCQENFCKEEKKKEHKEHQIIEINPKDEEYEKYYKIIEETNKELKRIVDFNKLVLNTGEKFQNNYFHLKSIINLGDSLQKGNNRNSKDTKCLLSGLKNDLENSKKIINNLKQSKEEIKKLKIKNKHVKLSNKELNCEDFKNISHITFTQLIELDISENKIINIEPFKTMSLPFLEFLNLGHNQISIIEPITELKSKNLQYIFLQNNQIEDLDSLLNSEFPSLKILRMENNVFKEEKIATKEEKEAKKKAREDKLKLISKKYNGKFFYKTIEEEINDFKKNYKSNDFSRDSEKIDLSDREGGDEMVKQFFLIITYKTKNNINELKLRNNKIKDPSILSRIHFIKLQTLDLSVNKISNINFLSDMKAKNLKYLYLDFNNLNGIYPLLSAKFSYLKVLSLNGNNFDLNNFEESPDYQYLMEKENKNEKPLEIQFIKEDIDKAKQNEQNNSNNVNDNNNENDNDINNDNNNKKESNDSNNDSKTVKSQ